MIAVNKLVACLGVLLLASCSLNHPRPNVNVIPVYPQSRVVRIEQRSAREQVAFLETNDDAATVLAWYEEQLQQEGWKLSITLHTRQGLVFDYASSPREPAYAMTVLVDTGKTGATAIEIYLVKSLPG